MNELTDDEIETVLERNAIGVLALVDEGAPYQVPICYGYDADTDQFVVQLTGEGSGHKHRRLAAATDASITIYEETEPERAWRSVLLRGHLREIDYQDAEPAFASIAMHSQSIPNPIAWADTPDRASLTPYELAVDERTGREFEVR